MRSYRYLLLIFSILLLLCAECSSAPYQPGMNLVTNPGFENGKSNWPQNPKYWDVITGVSHTGDTSIRISKINSSTYPMIIQSVPVQRNARYVISAWIKTDNVNGGNTGASIALKFYDSNNVYIPGGCYAPVVSGTSDWTHITATSIRTPPNTAKVTITLYMKNGCTGTAWFDDIDVNLLYDFNFRALILSPQYRNTAYHGYHKQLVLGIQADGNAMHPAETLSVHVTVKSPSGSSIKVSDKPDKNPQKWKNIKISTGQEIGAYEITAKLIDKNTSEVFASKDLTFNMQQSNSTMPKVYIDDQQRCVVDGKPFFPLGFYCSGSLNDVTGYIDHISESKFNCLMNYSTPFYSPDNIKQLLDTANKKNVKIIFSVKDCYDGSKWELKKAGPWEGSFNVLKGMVSTYKNHPAVLAWYINDELTGSFLPQIRQRYDYIKSADPDHPAWQVLYVPQDFAAHADCTDILGVDNYPVMHNSKTPNMYEFGDAARAASDAVMKSRGIWMVGECSTIRYDGINPSNRPPTYEEIMCEAYQGIINGARGLIFFGISDLFKFDGEKQWQIVKRAGDELHKIQPAILGTDSDTKQVSVSNSKISVLTRSVNSDIYVLAVNPYNEKIHTVFKLWTPKAASKAISAPFDNTQRVINITNGNFSDVIEPLGTRIYKLIP